MGGWPLFCVCGWQGRVFLVLSSVATLFLVTNWHLTASIGLSGTSKLGVLLHTLHFVPSHAIARGKHPAWTVCRNNQIEPCATKQPNSTICTKTTNLNLCSRHQISLTIAIVKQQTWTAMCSKTTNLNMVHKSNHIYPCAEKSGNKACFAVQSA